MRKRSTMGNVVRLAMDLDPVADLQALATGIAGNANFRFAVSLRMERSTLRMPRWIMTQGVEPADHITLHEGCTHDYFVSTVLHRDLSCRGSLVHVDLLRFATGGARLVISAHHALFDQRGMANLAAAIQPGAQPWPADLLFPERLREHWLPEFLNTVYIMFYMLGSPFWFMARLLRGRKGAVSQPVFKVVQLSNAQAALVDTNATRSGARFGNSNFHMAVTLHALQLVFDHRQERPPYFWLSMPVSKRRKGGAGHLFSNNLSFVFARVRSNFVRDIPRAVSSIHAQVRKQLGNGIPERYTSLLNFFRRVPLWLYSTLVNLPMRGDYASLSFSDLGHEGDGLSTFGGLPVLSTVDYASVPSPPGLTVTFKRGSSGLQVVIGAVVEALSPSEMERFERDLVGLLTDHGQ
ncbi:MAG: hypothetical protein ABI599_11985 [Flavobacteriales bacterium]